MALTDNECLNAMLALLRRIDKSVRNGYDTISGNQYTVSNAQPLTRPPMALCVRCVIVNLSATPVRIYENGILVEPALAQNAIWKSPTSGAGQIKVDTAGDDGATISIANYILN